MKLKKYIEMYEIYIKVSKSILKIVKTLLEYVFFGHFIGPELLSACVLLRPLHYYPFRERLTYLFMSRRVGQIFANSSTIPLHVYFSSLAHVLLFVCITITKFLIIYEFRIIIYLESEGS